MQNDNIMAFCAKADIKLSEAMARFSNMEAIYLKSLGLFTADLQKYAALLNNTNSTQDELKLIFHTLKSTAGALGFTQLAEQAKEHDHALATMASSDFDINVYQPFIGVLEKNLETVNHLILLLQNKAQPTTTASNVEFAPTYAQLKTEINHFNMRSSDTLQLITEPLKSLSAELTDELIASLNRLKFNDAKMILTQFDALITENPRYANKEID